METFVIADHSVLMKINRLQCLLGVWKKLFRFEIKDI